MDTLEREKLLGIYLNDHLAGASAGVALARRIARNHQRTTARRETEAIAVDVSEDRETLTAIMKRLDIRPKKFRNAAVTTAERVARFKLNGHLLTRSPLSSVIEFETMRLGVEGKLAGWRTLRHVADSHDRLDPDQLDRLCDRAQDQAQRLEDLRLQAIERALR